MIGRPNLQSRVVRRPSLRYHGGGRNVTRACIWHETDSLRWLGSGGTEEYLNQPRTLKDGRPNPHVKVASYHYAIEDDGTIYSGVDNTVVAYHAGVKCTVDPLGTLVVNGSANGRTIGIAFVTMVARRHPLTTRQIESGLWLGAVMQAKYGYPGSANFAHREIAPTWKSDPLAEHLDMDHWRALLSRTSWPEVITPFPAAACAA